MSFMTMYFSLPIDRIGETFDNKIMEWKDSIVETMIISEVHLFILF